MMEPVPIELSDEQRTALCLELATELDQALATHMQRAERYATFLKSYKARPSLAKKSFPWDGASNVVVPLVAIAVDSISARLQKAIFGADELVQVKIKVTEWEPLEKDLRDYLDAHLRNVQQAALRMIFIDEPMYGDAYVKLIWEEKKRKYHQYSQDLAGAVEEVEITDFIGPRWHVIHPSDVVYPDGYESFADVPWVSHILRLNDRELSQRVKDGMYDEAAVAQIRDTAKERQDPHYRTLVSLKEETQTSRFYELHEMWGLFKVPPENGEEDAEPDYVECILTFHRDRRVLLRAIYNPYFGRSRQIVKIPFLVQAHEMESQSISEQVEQFQESATASHNQVIDAGTAANAGILVTSPEVNLGPNEEIYPGKRITTEKPKEDVAVVRLSEASSTLGAMEMRAREYAQLRTGVGAYQLGQESSIVGSQATATGTTALIAEGNIRFWVSIDDMRRSIEDILYLMLQQIQQYAPQGVTAPSGKTITLPQGDPRTSLGLTLAVTSETLNRELEVRNIQMLTQMLQLYYDRVMQAAAVLQNPAFPPLQKAVILQVMNSAHDLMTRLVQRFDFENIETIVPNLMSTLQQMMGAMGAPVGPPGAVQASAGSVPSSLPGGPQSPTAGGGAETPGGGGPPGGNAPPGGGSIPL